MKSFIVLTVSSLLLHFAFLASASEFGFLLRFWQFSAISVTHYAICFFLFARVVKSPTVRAIGIIVGIALQGLFAFLGLVVVDGAHLIPLVFPGQKQPIVTYMANLTMYFVLEFASALILGLVSVLFGRRLATVVPGKTI